MYSQKFGGWGDWETLYFLPKWILASLPPLSLLFFLLSCHTHLFVRFKFNLNNSIKNSLLYSIGELSLFSFLPSVFRPVCLVPRASSVCGAEDPMPQAREGVERVELGLAQLVGGSGLCSSSAAVQNALLQGSLSVFTEVSLSFWRREDMGLCSAWFGLFLQFKEVIISLFFFLSFFFISFLDQEVQPLVLPWPNPTYFQQAFLSFPNECRKGETCTPQQWYH